MRWSSRTCVIDRIGQQRHLSFSTCFITKALESDDSADRVYHGSLVVLPFRIISYFLFFFILPGLLHKPLLLSPSVPPGMVAIRFSAMKTNVKSFQVVKHISPDDDPLLFTRNVFIAHRPSSPSRQAGEVVERVAPPAKKKKEANQKGNDSTTCIYTLQTL